MLRTFFVLLAFAASAGCTTAPKVSQPGYPEMYRAFNEFPFQCLTKKGRVVRVTLERKDATARILRSAGWQSMPLLDCTPSRPLILYVGDLSRDHSMMSGATGFAIEFLMLQPNGLRTISPGDWEAQLMKELGTDV